MRIKYRHRFLGMLFLLAVETYVDRVCISVAGTTMQEDLGLSPTQWGWVLGAFALSYGLFEVPSGALGDRIGPRRVLARIVTWWSAFTALTGADFMLPVAWAVCLDVGGRHAGAVSGAMNMAGQLASFLSSVAFGYIVVMTGGNWDAPLVPMTVTAFLAAVCWLRIDASLPLAGGTAATTPI